MMFLLEDIFYVFMNILCFEVKFLTASIIFITNIFYIKEA